MSGRYSHLRRWEIGIRYAGTLEGRPYPPSYKSVGWSLATCMSADGTPKRNPGQDTIAEYASVSERTVRDATGMMDADGWLHREGGRGRGNVYHYTATIPPAYEQVIEASLKGGSTLPLSGSKAAIQGEKSGTVVREKSGTHMRPSIAVAMLSGSHAQTLCAFCGATNSPSGFTTNRLGDRLCSRHNMNDAAYAAWTTIRTQERTEGGAA